MTTLSMLARRSLGAVAVATAAGALLAAPLAAQQPAKVQLAFGYHCDDKFALRNEGTQTADVQFVVLGTADKGRVTVKPNETVQIESATDGDVELYVDGKLVASEHKGNRSCEALTSAPSGTVTVRHLDPGEVMYVEPRYVQPVYLSPREVVYVRPWDYGYYYRPSFSLSLGFPLFRSGYYGGGYGRVIVHDRGGRVGRRHR
ncbi:MAG: hypothetical protein ACYC3L_03260 [Gemmatimonadaceae bacterium]